MQSLTGKIVGSTLTAAEWNQPMQELQNIIEDTGQVLSSGDLDQAGKGVAAYAAGGDFYIDSGAANVYVLGTVGSKQSPNAYFVSMAIRFIAGNANTIASTVNVNTLGVKTFKNSAGEDLILGDINSKGITEAIYDGTFFVIYTAKVHVLVYRTSNKTLTTGVNAFVDWDAEIFDSGGAHDNAVNNTRVTVPAGFTWARVVSKVEFISNAVGGRNQNLFLTGSGFAGQAEQAIATHPSGVTAHIMSSPWVQVIGGNYFELRVAQDSGGNLDLSCVSAENSWMYAEFR